MTSFLRSSSKLFLGSIAAQAIPLLALPFITRQYDPDAVGLQALAITWATAISVVATLRLDLAAVLPKDEKLSERIVHAALTTTLLIVPIVAILLAFGSQIALSLIGHSDASFWLWLLPVLSVGMALSQLGTAVQIRNRQFGRMSIINLVNQTTTHAVALAMGAFNPWLGGLVVSRVIGQIAAAATTFPRGLWGFVRSWRPTFHGYRAVLVESRKFVFFNTPYSLVSTVARDAPLLIFGALASATSVGLYGLARAVMFVPTSLASVSLGPVFFKEAADGFGSPQLERLATRLLRLGLVVPTAAFALVVVRGPELFSLIFGVGWAVAGEFAAILAPAFWFSLQSSWIGRIFEVSGRQRRQLWVQLSTDAALILAVWTSLAITQDLMFAATVFALLTAAQSCLYFFVAANAASFRLRPLVLEWIGGGGLFALMVIALTLVANSVAASLWISLALVVVLTLVFAGFLVRGAYLRPV